MAKRRIITPGEQFGLLVALRMTGDNSPHNGPYWECRCECGTPSVIVPQGYLIGGCKSSCGCKTKVEDLTGKTYNHLTVIGHAGGSYWDCKCVCGKVITVSRGNLLKGQKSCGCMTNNAKDITGHRCGRLVAVRPTDRRYVGQVIWECRCDCGNVIELPSSRLREGGQKSCGCLRRKNTPSPPRRNRFALDDLQVQINGLSTVITIRQIDPPFHLPTKAKAIGLHNNDNPDVNYNELNEKRDRLGKNGEAIVIALERARLTAEGYPGDLNTIKKVRDIDGYDIHSYEQINETGEYRDIYIEVKSTTSADKPFIVTANEVHTSITKGDAYRIYRLLGVTDQTKEVEYYILKGPIMPNAYKITPIAYEIEYTGTVGGNTQERYQSPADCY